MSCEQQEILDIINKQGYAIVEHDIDLSNDLIDKHVVTLPVKLTLDDHNPYNHELAKVKDYDWLNMSLTIDSVIFGFSLISLP
jgi:hypothetical protein